MTGVNNFACFFLDNNIHPYINRLMFKTRLGLGMCSWANLFFMFYNFICFLSQREDNYFVKIIKYYLIDLLCYDKNCNQCACMHVLSLSSNDSLQYVSETFTKSNNLFILTSSKICTRLNQCIRPKFHQTSRSYPCPTTILQRTP